MAKRKRTGAELGRDLLKMVEEIQKAAERKRPAKIHRAVTEAVRDVQPQIKQTVRAVTPLPNADPYTQLKKAGALDRKGRQKNAGPPRRPSERRHFVRQADGKVRVVTARQRRKLVREGKEQAESYELRKELMPWLLADKAKPSDRGEADTKVAGINIDRLTGKGGRAAIDILEETTRPVHAVAGGTRAAIKGENIPEAVVKGLRNEERYTFSDVLDAAGVENKIIKGAVGFGLDVALDPTTYLTLGAAVPAKIAARKAGERAVAEATAKGYSRSAVQRIKSQASREAYRQAPKSPKVTVGMGSHRVSTGVPAPQLGKKTRERLSKVLPVRPHDISPEEWAKLSAADRRRRGLILSETRRATRKATAIRKGMGGARRRVLPERPAAGAKARLTPRKRSAPLETSRRIRDAIERRDLTTLSEAEQLVAKALMEEQERLLQLRRAAGEQAARYAPRTADEPAGYVARQAVEEITDPAVRRKVGRGEAWAEGKVPLTARGTPRRQTTTLKDFQRGDRRPMSEVRKTDPGKYVEDISTTLVAKAQKDIGRAANTGYRGEVLELGRPLKPNAKWDRETEGVFTVKDGRLTEVSDKTFAGGKPADFVILKKSVADHANRTLERVGRIPFLDPLTNRVKWALTIPNPQYWSRNLYGGLYNAWQEGASAAGVARALPLAVKVGRRESKRSRAEETLGRVLKPPEKLPLGPNGQKIDVDDFIDEVAGLNVSGGGITSELLGAETRRRSKMQLFEDVPRLTAYIHFRRKGLKPDDAAGRALASQFDYGSLSHLERKVARRIWPFYTWRSRNIVLQTKTLAQRPGRLATFEKSREELGKGLPEDWQDKLTEGEALGVPIPIPEGVPLVGGQLAYPALPVTDLNVLSADLGALGQQLMGSAHPVAKAATEFWTGYSFYFRDQLEAPGRKWVSAPDHLIDSLPAGMREELIERRIVKKGKDRWTGEMTWQWKGRTDYLSKLVPASSAIIQAATSGRSRKGQKSGQRIGGYLTGVRTQPYAPELTKLFEKYDERAEVQDRIDDLIELKTYKGRDKKEYNQLRDQKDKLDVQIYRLEGTAGKKDRTEPQSLPESDRGPGRGPLGAAPSRTVDREKGGYGPLGVGPPKRRKRPAVGAGSSGGHGPLG